MRGWQARGPPPTRAGAPGTSPPPRTAPTLPPAEDRQALLRGQRLDVPRGLCVLLVVVRQEGDADGVRAPLRQVERNDVAQERVRNLGEDAGAVPRVRLGADGAPVVEVAQSGECVLDDVVPGLAAHGRDERDSAGVAL